MRRLTDIERGYLAGFMDGEGSIGICYVKRPAYSQLRLYGKFTSTNETVILKLRDLLGAGWIIKNVHNRWSKKPLFSLGFGLPTLTECLPQIVDLLIIKRRQAELAIAFATLVLSNPNYRSESIKQRMAEIYTEMRSLNKGKGSRRSEPNSRVQVLPISSGPRV